MHRTRLLMTFALLVAALALPSVTQAQSSYLVDYFDNANNSNLPDGTVRISNVGAVPGTGVPGVGDQCALLYVFAADQQLAECCGCRITPNGLLKLSVNNNLANNSLTAVTLTSGTIVLVPSTMNTTGAVPAGSSTGCDPGLAPVQDFVTIQMATWSTHIQDNGSITEGNFNSGFKDGFGGAYFSPAEVAALVAKCRLSNELGGSGSGLCNCPGEKTAALDPPPLPVAPISLPTGSAPASTAPKLSTPKLATPTSSTPKANTPILSASTASSTQRAPSTQR